jgi:hypothetical protein
MHSVNDRRTMQVHDKTISIDRSVWMQHGGVDVQERGGQIALTGRDDDSYLKVFNHFGRVLKLYTFEDGRWVDADTGVAAQPFDDSQAGHLPAAAALATAAPAHKAATRSAPRGTSSTSAGTATPGKAAGEAAPRKAAGKAAPRAKAARTKGGSATKGPGKRKGG